MNKLIELWPIEGTLSNAPIRRLAWTTADKLEKAVFTLLALENRAMTSKVIAGIIDISKADESDVGISVALDHGSIRSLKTESTVHALRHLVSAEAIRAMDSSDRRKKPLLQINRALAKDQMFRVTITLGNERIDLANLALASAAVADKQWQGDILVRARQWTTDRKQIVGSAEGGLEVTIDASRTPEKFDRLWQAQAAFVLVSGKGYVNRAGLRIVDIRELAVHTASDESGHPHLRMPSAS